MQVVPTDILNSLFFPSLTAHYYYVFIIQARLDFHSFCWLTTRRICGIQREMIYGYRYPMTDQLNSAITGISALLLIGKATGSVVATSINIEDSSPLAG